MMFRNALYHLISSFSFNASALVNAASVLDLFLYLVTWLKILFLLMETRKKNILAVDNVSAVEKLSLVPEYQIGKSATTWNRF